MPEEPPEAVAPSRASARPLRTAAVVIYATLALLAIAVPQSPANWLRDMKSSAIQETLLRGAEALEAASRRAGIDLPYRRARALFLAFAGKEEN
jgi:hypothetical protein